MHYVHEERNEKEIFQMILFYAPLMGMCWLLSIFFA